MATDRFYDVLILGSGLAGLSLALRIPETLTVAILAKRDLLEGNTLYAQGGISAVLDPADTLESHVQDTLDAGAGLCDGTVVRQVVERGPANIAWLRDQGVNFTRDEGTGAYHLTQEGGHSRRRVVHATDATGRAVAEALGEQVRRASHLAVFEQHIAIDLIRGRPDGGSPRCLGAYVLNRRSGRVETFRARFVVLATGGASKVYLYTSNPDVATGDGIAMGWRAGCRVANLEFMQFHPTCLYHPQAKSFLITEALRGEGAKLRLPDGSAFMAHFDLREELAPRDIVARAIDHEMKRLGLDCVYLDIRHQPGEFLRDHFPTVQARCLDYGIDMTRDLIPIVPAAHYTCGGIMTGPQARTDLTGLYAVGETAYTGLHGANRMASNSLLECLVLAEQAALDIAVRAADWPPPPPVRSWDESRVTDSDEEVVVSHNWDELRRFMWDYVGIVRTTKRLERAKRRVDVLRHEILEYYSHFRIGNDLLELRNLVEVADLIIRCALTRRESRGLHYTLDFPFRDDTFQRHPTVLIPDRYCPDPDLWPIR
ncbi:MAG: L-aspartate oxidase [Pseudomonadota bacterium]